MVWFRHQAVGFSVTPGYANARFVGMTRWQAEEMVDRFTKLVVQGDCEKRLAKDNGEQYPKANELTIMRISQVRADIVRAILAKT